jgi:hypothetical protein
MPSSEACPPVRLQPEEIAAVTRIIARHSGPEAEVRVVGRRAGNLDRPALDLGQRLQAPHVGPMSQPGRRQG